MDTVIHCDCGFEIRAQHEGALVAEVKRHAWSAHGMALADDEALLLAFRAELDEPGDPERRRRRPTPRTPEEER